MLELTRPTESRKVADWAELEALISGKCISKTELASAVAEARGSEADEDFITSIWTELRRQERLFVNPPFKIAEHVLSPQVSWKDVPAYVACLFWSLYGDPDKLGLEPSSPLFEHLACHAFATYLKGMGAVLREGPDGVKLKSAKAKIEYVARLTKEELVSTPKAYNDRGADLVAWKPFSDERTGKVIVLAQCAAGENWRGKSREVVLDAWQEYIRFSCRPMAGFAVPTVIPNSRWHDIGIEAGLLIYA